MKLDIKFWLKFSLLNLSLVAILGVLMRYKIGFEFPYLIQNHLLHSHSHFAFSGWITHSLMTLMIYFLQSKIVGFQGHHYKKTIIANLICSYGMLIFFIIQGYAAFSIFFSTATILVSFYFGYQFFKDLRHIDNDLLSKNWFKAAILFNVVSSFGTFYLAYMMATKNLVHNLYLSSIYFYLHFQYNGWFFFASMGLFFGLLNLRKSDHSFFETSFKLFVIACIPAYFLSTLWLDLPLWLYILTVTSAIIQVFVWFKLLFIIIKTTKNFVKSYAPLLRYILLFVGFALSLKFLLQLGSAIPSLSQLAFGFRPIVIAYLHLVLLAIFSLFLLFYIFSSPLFVMTKNIKFGLVVFTIGVILNEIILAVQGIASFSYTMIPYVNIQLLAAALILLFGIGYTAFYSIIKDKNNSVL